MSEDWYSLMGAFRYNELEGDICKQFWSYMPDEMHGKSCMLGTDCILVDSVCAEHRESEEDTTLKIQVKEFYE